MSPAAAMSELEEKMRRGENRFELWVPQNRTRELSMIMNHYPTYNHILRADSSNSDSTLVIFNKK